jgi:hypothetical protein
VLTTKGKELTVSNGFEYRKKGQNAAGTVQFWDCPIRRCNGRAHSAVGSTQLTEVTPHNHEPDAAHTEVRIRTEEMKAAASQQRNTPSRTLIAASRAGTSDETLLALPKYTAAQQVINRARKIAGAAAVDVPNLSDIVLQVCIVLFSIGLQVM